MIFILRRISFALAVYLFLVILVLPLLASNADFYLSGQKEALTLDVLKSWDAILEGKRVLLMYTLLAVILAIMMIWLLITTSSLDSRCKMQRITPYIKTPYPDGQGQFGTARWLPKNEYRNFFSIWKLPNRDPSLQALLKAGIADKKEIQHADIRIN